MTIIRLQDQWGWSDGTGERLHRRNQRRRIYEVTMWTYECHAKNYSVYKEVKAVPVPNAAVK